MAVPLNKICILLILHILFEKINIKRKKGAISKGNWFESLMLDQILITPGHKLLLLTHKYFGVDPDILGGFESRLQSEIDY